MYVCACAHMCVICTYSFFSSSNHRRKNLMIVYHTLAGSNHIHIHPINFIWKTYIYVYIWNKTLPFPLVLKRPKPLLGYTCVKIWTGFKSECPWMWQEWVACFQRSMAPLWDELRDSLLLFSNHKLWTGGPFERLIL